MSTLNNSVPNSPIAQNGSLLDAAQNNKRQRTDDMDEDENSIDDLYDQFNEDEGQLYELIISKVPTEHDWHSIKDQFNSFASYQADLCRINRKTQKAFVVFTNEQDYLEAKNYVGPIGVIQTNDAYDPTVNHSEWYRIYLTFGKTYSEYVSERSVQTSIASMLGHEASSVTLNLDSRFAMVYFEKESHWLNAQNLLMFENKKLPIYDVNARNIDNPPIVPNAFLSIHTSFSATNSYDWTKLWVGGIPKNTRDAVMSKVFRSLDIKNAIFGSYRDKDSHQSRNYGFLFCPRDQSVKATSLNKVLKGKELIVKKAVPSKKKNNTLGATQDPRTTTSMQNINPYGSNFGQASAKAGWDFIPSRDNNSQPWLTTSNAPPNPFTLTVINPRSGDTTTTTDTTNTPHLFNFSATNSRNNSTTTTGNTFDTNKSGPNSANVPNLNNTQTSGYA